MPLVKTAQQEVAVNYVRGRTLSTQVMMPLRSVALMTAVLVLGLMLGRAIPTMDPYFFILVSLGIACALIFLPRTDLALAIYAVSAPMWWGASPGAEASESGVGATILPCEVGIVLLAGLVLLRKASLREKAHFPELVKPFAAFLAVAFLSVVSTYVIWDSDISTQWRRLSHQVAEVLLYSLCLVGFLVAVNSFEKSSAIQKMIWPMILLGLYVTVAKLVPSAYYLHIARNLFIPAIALMLVLAKLLFGNVRGWARFGWMLLMIPFLWTTYHTLAWVSGWLAASLGMWIVIWLKSKPVAILLAVIGVSAVFGAGLYHDVYYESESQGDMDRFIMWSDASRMAWSVNPVLGVGPGSYMHYGRKYSTLWYGNNTYTTAHSNYAQTIGELGIAGILSFLWLVVAGISLGLRVVRESNSELKWFSVGATAVFTSFAVVSLFGDYLLPSRINGGIYTYGTSVQVWLLFGAAVAGHKLSQKEKAAKES